MKSFSKALSFLSIPGFILLSGCSSPSPSPSIEPKQLESLTISSEPVTLTAVLADTNLDDDFIATLQELLGQKHPNITLEYMKPGKGTTLNELIAAGNVPDIVITYNGAVASYKEQHLLHDMNPLLKRHQFDLSRFEPYVLEDAMIASENGELYGIPINMNYHALYYNKDIFDKFGVPYPTDGMQWDQVYQLARQVTRIDSGTQYRGFDPGSEVIWISQPLGIAAVDYQMERATVNNDQWKKVFELVKSFYAIPGNEPKGGAKDAFMKDKTLAMMANLSIVNELEAAEKDGLNWDVVQYPSYPEKPDTYGNASVIMMLVTEQSRYKDQAMQVIAVAASDEMQLKSAMQGRVTPMKDPKFKEAFGQGREVLKNKNTAGIFRSKPVKYPIASKYRGRAEEIVRTKFRDYASGKTDVNTALAQAEEEINKMIESSTK